MTMVRLELPKNEHCIIGIMPLMPHRFDGSEGEIEISPMYEIAL